MEHIIDAIIIDTSVLINHQFDFLGWTSKTLPALYDLLEEKNIKLLNSFILDSEIKKHIPKSVIIERTEGLEQSFKRNKDFLKLIGINAEESIAKLKSLDLKNEISAEYIKRYSQSIMLPIPEAQNIFLAYFADEPPFNSKKDKKSEFPDAFIIDAVKNYAIANKEINILVVSDDNDWQSAFASSSRISVCSSIDEAILTIQNSDKIIPIISDIENEILESVSVCAECEAYDISEYEIARDVEIKEVIAESIDDIIPLKISPTSVLLKCSANLKARGNVRIVDYERSYYDSEDGKYYFISYSDIEFENANATVECEVNVTFSSDEEDTTANVDDVKIITKYDIDLDLSHAEIKSTECSEDDLALEALREDMGL